ncbi:MAG TPA: hypothetical protein VLH39_02180 [Magnetospirillaceae bacterium]|nr:hypothetical protein [Magnetospirillaceae bacterium]
MTIQRAIAVMLLASLSAGATAALPEITVRFFDKRVYHTDSEIFLRITISNPSAATYRFKLAEDRMFSVAFEARTPTNRILDASDAYRRTIAASGPVFFREVSLGPGEEFSFVEDLRRYVRMDEAGVFRVRALFHPDLLRPNSVPVASPDILVSVRPGAGIPTIAETLAAETGDILRAERIPPDEVIRRTLEARQKGRWNEFFLYLDLEALLTRVPERKRSYDRESDEGRTRMLNRYREELERGIADADLTAMPIRFDILETRYTASAGTVMVLKRFQQQQIRLVREYTYQMRRRDDIWYVVGYTIVIRGTE